MTAQRIVAGAPATLSVFTTDSDGTLADVTGPVTVGVARADGTVVVAAGTATTRPSVPSTGIYQVAVTAAQTSQLDQLKATWTDAASGVARVTYHETCGAVYATLAEIRTRYVELADTSKYPDAAVLLARRESEDECEDITDRSFIPRYARCIVDGSGTEELVLPVADIRRVRSVRIYPTADLTSITYTTLTASQLAGLRLGGDDPTIRRTDFSIFDEGLGNVVVDVEYGFDAPPATIVRALLNRVRWRLVDAKSKVPDRATTFSVADGGTYKLDSADAYKTGVPDVDAVYERYSRRQRGGIYAPASRPLELDPQRYAIYHGGRR